MTGKIWLIGGTQESATLARALIQAQVPAVVTVTTETARSLYPCEPQLQIWVGQLSEQPALKFIHQFKIQGILDASHPFAVEISHLAIALANQLSLPYLRYERPSDNTAESSSKLLLPDLAALLSGDYLQSERVLLTLGYRSLAQFQRWQTRSTLFARILPSQVALESAWAAGFTPDRLIALRPPISAALERALWQQWQISTVVTKASGMAGGEPIKQQVATELGIRLIVIARPEITYPQQTSNLDWAIAVCRQWHSRLKAEE